MQQDLSSELVRDENTESLKLEKTSKIIELKWRL